MLAGLLTAFIGSVEALILIGLAQIIKKHHRHLPGGKSSEVAIIACIALMLLAGVLMAFAGVGTWLVAGIGWVEGQLGAFGPAIFALVALYLAVKVAIALFRQPNERAMTQAFLLPVVGAALGAGIFHQMDAALAPLAHALTFHIASFLGA